MSQKTILYIHGMGGGGDSRIPGVLREWFMGKNVGSDDNSLEINVVVRTYDYNPDRAQTMIKGWVDEIEPSLIIGESLGACHAILASEHAGTPCIFVSPSLNAPLYLGLLSWLSLIPGMPSLLRQIYKVRPGDRQYLDFKFNSSRRYLHLRRRAVEYLHSEVSGAASERWYAFFGTRDHYRKSGIVSVRTWKRFFPGESFELYEGTHFMEMEYIYSLLIPKIIRTLQPKYTYNHEL